MSCKMNPNTVVYNLFTFLIPNFQLVSESVCRSRHSAVSHGGLWLLPLIEITNALWELSRS